MDWKDEKAMDQAIVFIYYCNRLREGGFIEGGPVITVEAFDRAVDLVDGGFKITLEFAKICCIELEIDIRIADLVMHVQELGLQEMIRISKEQENEEQNENN